MPEKIGKYRILERIGRGGMGTVLKAHDPVLDRVVALKVISSDVEITDELRARFFREAQACARLSHPNIITVYDLADVDGHLFIVMEFLEGEELKQVIAQRRPLLLEDKLSLMAQVCDGLHYAHQHGIVHRDVKPGNIFVLRDGHVKILDFGIARIASAEAGLTRTGLIMGTLRYMAPEQARGHSDHRADIFSAGTVFYELLAYRPAFAGADPMEILEQLRTQDPPSLVDVDPTMPPVLATLIARALRKDPAERFSELGQMRRELEMLRRRMTDDADRLRDGLRARLRQVRELETRAEQIGGAFDDDTMPVVEGAAGLVPLQMIERQIARRAERVQGLLARADALEAAASRGLELLAAGDHQAAVEALESVVTELPRHPGAVEGLERARQRLEEDRRRRELMAQLLGQARSAHEQGSFAACLDTLRQLAESMPVAAMEPEVEALRQAAETALAAHEAEAVRREALRRERERAERVQARVAQARRAGEQLGAPQDAAPAWGAAERKAADASAAFAAEAYARAVEHLEVALNLYRQAEGETRDVARRRARDKASAARTATVEARREAAASGADTGGGATWTGAADKEARAGTAFEREEFGLALVLFSEAARDYQRAAEAVRQELLRRQRAEADQARERSEQARRAARDLDAATHASTLWSAAEGKHTEGETALGAGSLSAAAQTFAEALELYRRAETESRSVRQAREEQDALREREQVARTRAAAEEAGAAASPGSWTRAAAAEGQGVEALSRGDHATARARFVEARRAYEQASRDAREEQGRRQRERAERARRDAERARARAVASAAARYAPSPWSSAESLRTQAERALTAEDVAGAHAKLTEAEALYVRAETEARAAATEAQAAAPVVPERQVPEMADDLDDGTVLTDATNDGTRMVTPVEVASAGRTPRATPMPRFPASHVEGRTERERPWHQRRIVVAGALGALVIAGVALFFVGKGRSPGEDSHVRERATVAALGREVATAREAAVAAQAEQRAPDAFRAGAESERRGAEEFGGGLLPAAEASYKEALERFQAVAKDAEAAGRRERERAAAVAAQERTTLARTTAQTAGAAKLAPGLWAKAGEAQRSAEAALRGDELDQARARFAEAEQAFQDAGRLAESTRDLRQAAEQASAGVSKTRREAEQAGAPRLAGQKFASARQFEDDATAALGRLNYGAALDGLREADAAYREATQQARGLAGRSAEVDRARGSAAAARDQALKSGAMSGARDVLDAATARWNEAEAQAASGNLVGSIQAYKDASDRFSEAERRMRASGDVRLQAEMARARRDVALRLGADILAKDAFDVGSAKLGEGDTLARAQNWAAAGQAYGAAIDRYGEAERRAKEIGDIRAQAEITKGRREQALKAGAEALAKDAFDAAVSRHTEADRLARGASVTAAIPVYRDAASRYVEAERLAAAAGSLRSQADAARDRMQGEKRRARGEAPEFAQALVHERQGTEAYQRLAFPGAVEQFARAADLFAKASAPAAPQDPRDEIRAVLNSYVRAFETKDGKLLQTVRPSLKPEDIRRYNSIWDMVSSFRIVLKVEQIDIRGDMAEVKGRREDVLIMKDGRREAGGGEREFTFTLKRGRTGWTIDTVN
jgi:Protein kinase domain